MLFPIVQKENAMLWIDYLEITRYKQGKHQLGSEVFGFCCLGVGAKLFKIPFNPAQTSSNAFVHLVGLTPQGAAHCIQLNDQGRRSFSEIAQEMRSHPEKFFSWAEAKG